MTEHDDEQEFDYNSPIRVLPVFEQYRDVYIYPVDFLFNKKQYLVKYRVAPWLSLVNVYMEDLAEAKDFIDRTFLRGAHTDAYKAIVLNTNIISRS